MKKDSIKIAIKNEIKSHPKTSHITPKRSPVDNNVIIKISKNPLFLLLIFFK